MKKSTLITICTIVFNSMAFASDPWDGMTDVEDWLDTTAAAYVSSIQTDRDTNYRTNSKINLAIAVVTPDWIDFKGYGEVEDGASPPTASMIYPLGSISKTMTGVILAKLIEDGRYGINDYIRYKLTTTCYKNNVGWRTFKQLTAHSGAYKTMPGNWDSTYSGRELCTCLANRYCNWANPQIYGVDVNYSNLGSGLLGITLVEADSGISDLADLFDTYLTGSSELGMEDTMLVRDHNSADPDMTQGYDEDAKPQDAAKMGVLGSAGEMAASANDMIKFLQMLTVQSAYQSDWLSVMKRACTNIAPRGSGYTLGYGLRITTEYHDSTSIGHTAYDKTGTTGQHNAYIFWSPSVNSKVGIFAAINTAGYVKVNGDDKKVIDHMKVLVQELYKQINDKKGRTRF